MTGECLKCVFNTHGFNCDRCLTGYYGDALATPKGQCQACSCHPRGSIGGASGGVVACDANGQCPCLRNVAGQRCDQCIDGFWNIDSGSGEWINTYEPECTLCISRPLVLTSKVTLIMQLTILHAHSFTTVCLLLLIQAARAVTVTRSAATTARATSAPGSVCAGRASPA